MAEWKSNRVECCFEAGDFIVELWTSIAYPGAWIHQVTYVSDGAFHRIQATDAEAAKAEAVALFRAKLEAALKEIEGL